MRIEEKCLLQTRNRREQLWQLPAACAAAKPPVKPLGRRAEAESLEYLHAASAAAKPKPPDLAVLSDGAAASKLGHWAGDLTASPLTGLTKDKALESLLNTKGKSQSTNRLKNSYPCSAVVPVLNLTVTADMTDLGDILMGADDKTFRLISTNSSWRPTMLKT
jgi:hypothetical protein